MAFLFAAVAGAQGPSTAGLDPEKVVAPEACGECHFSAFAVWQKTPHATGFKSLHRESSAATISERMGVKLMKRESVCLDCHYTPTLQGGKERAAAGVSCESCHGEGRDYIDVHNDYGGKGIDHTTETAEHRAARIAESIAGGMRLPSNLYAVASNCYGCHTVPNERLVNQGRHTIGTTDFELVERLSGAMRHNFLDSFLNGDGSVNAERSPEHKRRMYVVGQILAAEHSLRGLAGASENGVYLKAMQRRMRGAASRLRTIAKLGELPEVDAMVEAIRQAPSRLGNTQAQLAAADRIANLATDFLSSHDGTRLAKLDPLVAGEEIELDDDVVLAEADEGLAPLDGGAGDGSAGDGSGIGGGADGTVSTDPGGTAQGGGTRRASAGTGASSSTAVAAIPAQGDKRTHLRPRSSHATLEASTCQKCHGDQNAWWFDDRHYASIEPFFESNPANVRIARLYGIDPRRMARGSSLCMDCHGTIASGREKSEVEDGVSCQSCHGPAADYLEVHQEGDKSLGARRPGFVAALKSGMKNLHDLETAIDNCSSCHYITDPRLLSAGHPSGVGFDIAAGMAQVRHWQAPLAPEARIASTWATALGRRGAVPEVRLARLAGRVNSTPSGAAAGGASVRGVSGAANRSANAGSPGVSRTARSGRGADRTSLLRGDGPRLPDFKPRPGVVSERARTLTSRDSATGTLPDFPELDDETPLEDVLLLLGRQLELLYQAVGGSSDEGGGE